MGHHKATLEQLQTVNREDFSNYYVSHKLCDTLAHFNITSKVCQLLVAELNLPKLGHGGSTKFGQADKLEKDKLYFLENVNIEEFINYYYSHSDSEVCKEYKLNKGNLLWKGLIKEFGLNERASGENRKLGNKNNFDYESYKLSRRAIGDNYTEAEKQAIYDKRHATEDRLYGHHNMGICETRLTNNFIRHGDPYGSNREQARITSKARYGKEYYSQTDDFKNLFKQEEFLANFLSKMYASKRLNNSFKSSTPENLFYIELCKEFGVDNVKRGYDKDPRYPFSCDFYITSKDLFIELNLFYMHGPHPFDPNSEEDLKLLEEIRSKQGYYINSKGKLVKNSYYNYEDVGTVRDVEKRTVALKNNLNYLEIF